jgi:streptogramin lyase
MLYKHSLKVLICATLILISLMSACVSEGNDDQEIGSSTENSELSEEEIEIVETESEPLDETRIFIDGKSDDWENYPSIAMDPQGDQVPGSPDIGEIRAFNNDSFFYLLIDLHENGVTDHYDLLLDVDGGDFNYQISINPLTNQAFYAAFPITRQMVPIGDIRSAEDDVIEIKFPLSYVGKKPVTKLLVQTYLGDRIGDFAPDLMVRTLNEIEVIGLQDIQDNKQSGQKPCQGEATGYTPTFTLTMEGVKAELIWHSEFVPWWIRTGPDGRVYGVTEGSDSIYELKPDGSLDVAFTCPGVTIESGLMASDGAFWFTDRYGGALYRADPSGDVKIMAESGNRYLEAGLNGTVYALENGLERIDPDGTRTMITRNVSGRKFAIGPNGEMVVMRNGSVVQISDTGGISEIATGYGPDHWLTFGPDSLLYVTHWTGVDFIDLETGSVETIPWLVNSNIGESGEFLTDGRLLLYHPNRHVFVVDLVNKTIDIFIHVTSNTWAMAVSPGGEVYVAFGDTKAEGETTIFRINDMQSLEPVMTVPSGHETAMAFDLDGIGYIGLLDRRLGTSIIAFDPMEKTFEEYAQPSCRADSIALDPTTNRIWWSECQDIASLDQNGEKVTIQGIENWEDSSSLAITTDGTFYTIRFFPRNAPTNPYPRAIYRWNEIKKVWDEIADITQRDPGVILAKLVGCSEGSIYTVESLSYENLPINRTSMNSVRRLEKDGTLTLIGFDFAYDGQAVSCHSEENILYFTSGAGIFMVTLP